MRVISALGGQGQFRVEHIFGGTHLILLDQFTEARIPFADVAKEFGNSHGQVDLMVVKIKTNRSQTPETRRGSAAGWNLQCRGIPRFLIRSLVFCILGRRQDQGDAVL